MPIIDTKDDPVWATCNRCSYGFRSTTSGPILTTTSREGLVSELQFEDWEYTPAGEVYCPGHSLTRNRNGQK